MAVTAGVVASPINTERGIFCLPGDKDCGHVPICSIYDCDKYPTLHGCGGEVELRSLEVERDAQTALAEQSCALVCNKDRCLYVPEPKKQKRDSDYCKEPYVDGLWRCASASEPPKEKRNSQDDLWCFVNSNEQDVCMIPRAAKEEKRAADTDFHLPCPFICDQHGMCVCTGETEKRATDTDSFSPYPFDYNKNGTWTCLNFDVNRKCCVAPENNTSDCIITKRDTEFNQKRDTAFVRPCPPICNKSGHCACATESVRAPSVDKTMKRETDYRGPPCPSGNLICDISGCKCGGPFIIPINGPPKMEKRDEDFRGPPCPTGSLICNTSGCECSGPPIVPINDLPTKTREESTGKGEVVFRGRDKLL